MAMLLAGALAAGGCGGGGGGVTGMSPAPPLNLTVYINDSRVSLSPGSVGAGTVVLIVTNQAGSAKSLSLLPAGSPDAQPVASTAPISPQGTAQMKVGLSAPGDYSLTTAVNGPGGAPPSATAVQAATLHIGPSRPSGSNDLLQP
jgi:hypothetical protein